ncbi:MAG: hypothetical protein VKJ64_07595 [Leptolyngbyaceae bacterium]|nr:hypothetical protein [Leptolyngbyaceae bacterium]
MTARVTITLDQLLNCEHDRTLLETMYRYGLEYTSEGLILGRYRVLSAGQLGPWSEGGLINPGVLPIPEGYGLMVRAEPNDATWVKDFRDSLATPIWCVLDQDMQLLHFHPLSNEGLPPNSRAEDWRLFQYGGELYSNHSLYWEIDEQLHCYPVISRVDLAAGRLELLHILNPPFPRTLEEKNWNVFVHHDGDRDRLLCIYRFKPYQLLEIDLNSGQTTPYMEPYPQNWAWHNKGDRFISSSTNLIIWDESHYITFVHDYLESDASNFRNRTYMQYAVLVSRQSLLPVSVIPHPLLMGGYEQGRHPGVHYTMALVRHHDQLLAFYGEGDSHTGVAIIDANRLDALFLAHRLPQETALIPDCNSISPSPLPPDHPSIQDDNSVAIAG